MRFVPGGFSCTNLPTSCIWRKVVDGYKRNIVSLPKHHIWISLRNLNATRCSKHRVRPIGFYNTCWCDPLFATTPPILSNPGWLNGSKGREFNLGFRNSVFWFPGIIKWKWPNCGLFLVRIPPPFNSTRCAAVPDVLGALAVWRQNMEGKIVLVQGRRLQSYCGRDNFWNPMWFRPWCEKSHSGHPQTEQLSTFKYCQTVFCQLLRWLSTHILVH